MLLDKQLTSDTAMSSNHSMGLKLNELVEKEYCKAPLAIFHASVAKQR